MSVTLGWCIWLCLLSALAFFVDAAMLRLLLVIFFPLLFAGLAAVFYASRLFSVRFAGDATGSKGEDMVLPIEVHNPTFIPLPRVSCRIHGKNRLTGEAFEQQIAFSVGPREKRVIPFKIRSKYCGRISLSMSHVRLFEYFGLLFVPLKVEKKSGMTAMPVSFSLLLLAVLERSVPDESDEYSTRKSGHDPSEIFQIREYRPGDSIRQIHWKLTMKFDELMTKEASLPVEQSVLILFDTHRTRQHPTTPSRLDAAVEVLVSLSQALIDEGIPHRVAYRSADNGSIVHTNISTTDDMPELLSGVLSAPEDNGVSALEFYRIEKGTPGVSHLFCICAGAPSVPDSSFGVETTVLCAYDGKTHPADNDGVFYFGSETYREELSTIAF